MEKSKIDIKFKDKILNFLMILLKENEHLNVISRKLDIDTILKDHFLDCLIPAKYFNDYKSITDLGSGSGLPGVLLSIIYSDKSIKLIEKSPKKAKYLGKVLKELSIKNAVVIEGLAEHHRIETEVITARAFKSIVEILDKTKTFFNNNGEYLLYKGRMETINEELTEANRFKFECKIINIKEIEDKERNLVHIIKH